MSYTGECTNNIWGLRYKSYQDDESNNAGKYYKHHEINSRYVEYISIIEDA